MDNISMKLLGLESTSDNVIKSKAIKYIIKKILCDYELSHLIFAKTLL